MAGSASAAALAPSSPQAATGEGEQNSTSRPAVKSPTPPLQIQPGTLCPHRKCQLRLAWGEYFHFPSSLSVVVLCFLLPILWDAAAAVAAKGKAMVGKGRRPLQARINSKRSRLAIEGAPAPKTPPSSILQKFKSMGCHVELVILAIGDALDELVILGIGLALHVKSGLCHPMGTRHPHGCRVWGKSRPETGDGGG
ncbi:ATP phosphoribosyltransferase regulatory subunit [Striga asiatica]|uniref:ATP phosphoribosyltransferase regulatory subunit n=1 Tax=Striga asiatica TaxID=4170 RepID=A0A5A7PU80_STRAF|nr:ATP phosphoribosyltransferase regulatory subunit [Striga asiatica]